MRRMIFLLGVVLLLAAPAHAQRRPTFSLDFQGPIALFSGGFPDLYFGVPISDGDILTTGPPGPPGPNPAVFGPVPPPGIMVASAPGAPFGVFPGGLGIGFGPAGMRELDALSYGHDQGNELMFSVDEFAVGIPGASPPPNVATEGAFGALEASADVYTYLGAVVPTAPGPVIGNLIYYDGDGFAPPGPAVKGLGLVEPNPPTFAPGGLPDPGDNLDAVDIDTRLPDFPGPIYFSLDSNFADPYEGFPANSGTAIGNGFSGADILIGFAGAAPALACPAVTLGLDLGGFDTDDLDALAFDDTNGDMLCTPGADTLLFSVRRASAVIGVADSCFGVAIEEGDVLTFPAVAGAPPCIFVAAEALGLATVRSGSNQFPLGDELDALDVVIAHQVPALPIWALAPLGALLLALGVRFTRRR